ncbi:MAG: T9SS type A sorting domain-containing protein, partial [Rhodothermales bacterium]|nr:T9SS type A sorting domain-containing protein [Rhodothermales bacterium]
TGKALNGATITIGGETYTTDTHASLFRFYSGDPNLLRNGFYYLEDVAPGTQTVAVAAPGFEADEFLVEPVDSFFTFFDVQLVSNVPPTVVSSTPGEGTGAFRIVDPIVINFSRGMNRASVESAFSLEPAVGGRFLWSNNDFTLTVRPDSLLPLTAMTLTLAGSATGAFGDPFDGNGDGVGGDDFVISFTTGPADTQAPGIADTYPAIRQAGVELDPIVTVVINEEVDPTSISPDQIRVITGSGDAVAGLQAHHAVGERSVLSFFPAQALQPLTSYIVTIAPGLKDLVGNQRTTQQQFNFSTGATNVERDIIDDFESDLMTNWWVPGQSGSTTGIVPGSTSRSAETRIVHLGVGSATALRVDFEWEEGAGSTLLREYLVGGAPKAVVFDSTYALETYVFGDGSGTLLRFAVDDRVPVVAAGNHEVSPWYTIDWYGWRLISWRPARDGTGVWIGDGVLDGNLIFDSIQLSRSAGASATGSIVIDDLSITRPAVVTGVEQEGDVPNSFELMQNYPNPFRGSTTIRLNLPESGALSVAVFSLLGEEIARLTDDRQYAAGPVEFEWDATGVPSGVYFTRARFGRRIRTVQMVVIR